MLFLSPLFLWALLAAAVPVLIHLINRRRHKVVAWAAMQFLLKAARQSRGKRKLRHILILACRCLVIGGLVTAAARPVVSQLMGWGGGSVDTVVLLLDRSASMEAKPGDGLKSRRELVLEKVAAAMADLGNPRLVLLDSASGQPQEIPSPDVLAGISSTAETDTAANIPDLLNRAAEFLGDLSGRSEIWLASDLQASNWRVVDQNWATARASLSSMARPPQLRVLNLSGPVASNVAVHLLGARRVDGELQLQIELTHLGAGRPTVPVPVSIHLDDVSTTESLSLSGQSLTFQKSLRLPEGSETGFGWVSVPADGNLRDNVAFFAYGPARESTTLVVSPAGESADYLALSAAPPGMDGLSVKQVLPAEAAFAISPDLTAVLWAAPLPQGAAAEALKSYLNSGGQVLFLPPGVESTQEFMGFRWAAVEPAPRDQFFILQDWNRDDGLLRDGIDGTPLAADRLKAIFRQLPIGDVTPLARWQDGEPALARQVMDKGTVWFLGSIPDYTWSNLGDADILLPAVQRLIEAGADRFNQAYQASLSSATERLLAAGDCRRVDGYGSAGAAHRAYLSGVYHTGDRLLAVNRPAHEDLPGILEADELDQVLQGTGYTRFDQAGAADDAALSRDVWRAFLVAALGFLIAEALLCLPKKSPTVVIPSRSGF